MARATQRRRTVTVIRNHRRTKVVRLRASKKRR